MSLMQALASSMRLASMRYTKAQTPYAETTAQQGVVKTIWHEENPIVYSASLDGSVKVWDGRSGECKHVSLHHAGLVFAKTNAFRNYMGTEIMFWTSQFPSALVV